MCQAKSIDSVFTTVYDARRICIVDNHCNSMRIAVYVTKRAMIAAIISILWCRGMMEEERKGMTFVAYNNP